MTTHRVVIVVALFVVVTGVAFADDNVAIPPPPDMGALEAKCRMRDVATCAAVAELYTLGTQINRDLPRARAAWQRTCELGESIACARAKSISKLMIDDASCTKRGDA